LTPDVVLLAVEWQPRALLRAQLIEEGFDVVATNRWPAMRRHLRPGSKPELAIIDLKGLPNPSDVLRDVRVLMKPARVLVLTAMGTIAPDEVAALGFQTVSRPIALGDVARRAAAAIRSLRRQADHSDQ